MVRIVERRGEVCIMPLLYARPRGIVNRLRCFFAVPCVSLRFAEVKCSSYKVVISILETTTLLIKVHAPALCPVVQGFFYIIFIQVEVFSQLPRLGKSASHGMTQIVYWQVFLD